MAGVAAKGRRYSRFACRPALRASRDGRDHSIIGRRPSAGATRCAPTRNGATTAGLVCGAVKL